MDNHTDKPEVTADLFLKEKVKHWHEKRFGNCGEICAHPDEIERWLNDFHQHRLDSLRAKAGEQLPTDEDFHQYWTDADNKARNDVDPNLALTPFECFEFCREKATDLVLARDLEIEYYKDTLRSSFEVSDKYQKDCFEMAKEIKELRKELDIEKMKLNTLKKLTNH